MHASQLSTNGVNTQPTERAGRATRVRYRVLAAACVLAVLTYLNRLGFNVAAPEIKRSLDLTDADVGYLAAAFLTAYGLCQVPGGLLGDRLGSRHLLTVLVLSWSLLSAATALALGMTTAAALPFLFLLGVRFLFGVFQAAEFPTLTRIIADWMPTDERASAQGLVWTFSRIGGACVPFLFALMLDIFGTWTTPFWVMGGLGVLWCALFWPWFRNRPEQIPSVNAAERARIAVGRSESHAEKAAVPLWLILSSTNVWALCAMYALNGFAGNFFTSLLPLYLSEHRGITGFEFSCLSAVPLACGIVSCTVGGVVSDAAVRRWDSPRWGRRVSGMLGLALAGLGTLLLPWVDGVWLLALVIGGAFFFSDLNMGPAWAAAADLGSRTAGTVSGAMNMVGAFAGAGGMALAGWLFTHGHANLVFVIFGAAYALGAVCWLAVDVSRPLLAPQGKVEADPMISDPVEV